MPIEVCYVKTPEIYSNDKRFGKYCYMQLVTDNYDKHMFKLYMPESVAKGLGADVFNLLRKMKRCEK